MAFSNSPEYKAKKQNETLALIQQRGHEYIQGSYENKNSVLTVYCPTHEEMADTTFSNYTRSSTGMECCGNAQVSEKLKGRVFSEETLEKMTIANNKRPNRGGKPRRWRENHGYRVWKSQARELYGGVCAITGEQPNEPGDLVVHHLEGSHDNPHLILVPENGILIKKELHKKFHDSYGYKSNTIEQFQSFLDGLLKEQEQNPFTGKQPRPISSQANPGGLEGSETRVYDAERIKKLHERLESLKAVLRAKKQN